MVICVIGEEGVTMERLLRIVAVAAVAGAMVAVPVAAARSGARASVPLSVLPLPAPSLGSEARSLPLQRDSGLIDNTSYWGWTIPLYPNRWNVAPPTDPATKLGRVSGYALDYGHGASGGAGITEVRTSVDEYKTRGDAAKSLRYWRRLETNGFLESAVRGVLSATTTREEAAAVGNRRFAVLAAYSAQNVAPLFGLDEQFTVGRYEADVTVWAGSAAKAKKLAPRLATKLGARIKKALDGRLHAKPVKLPPSEGSPGGPDLAPLGLKMTDLSGQASYTWRGYEAGPVPFSVYHVQMAPAGQFAQLDQEIFWYPTANEARFNDDYEADQAGPGALDLSSVGDGAWGVLYDNNPKTPGGVASLFFSSGKIEEFVWLRDPNDAILPSQAESIARIVASYINAAGFGG